MIDKLDYKERLLINGKSDELCTDKYINTIIRILDKNKKEVFKGANKVILSGSEFLTLKLFNLGSNTFTTPSYNTQLDLDNSQLNTGNDLSDSYKVFLFAMGTSGCAMGSQIKYEVSTKKWIDPKDLVPFRYRSIGSDLDDVNRRIYYGRKEDTTIGKISYYFKRFDSEPVLTREFEDGTPWSSSVYSDDSALKANTRVSLVAKVNENDGREYFNDTIGITNARFNCIELLLAWPYVVNGYTYYQDIRPFTRLNFPNRPLSELGDSYEIIYDLYF